MNKIEDLVKEIAPAKEERPKTYTAEVSHTDEEGVVWVRLPGAEQDTPTASTSSEVKMGDTVTIEWRNNKLYIAGNYTNPSAGVARVTNVEAAAQVANQAAQAAVADAETARTAAESAQASATQAATSASEAKTQAENASEYAARALGNLSTVQSVAETLTWITQHGTMTLTTDIALDPTHVYFVQDSTGDYVVGGTHYAVVTEPDADDLSSYYVLSIDESLNNYVATHLAVDSEGLWIIPDANGNRVLIATGQGTGYPSAGTYIIDGGGDVVASFLASGARIGGTGSARADINSVGFSVFDSGGGKCFDVNATGAVTTANMTRKIEVAKNLSANSLPDTDPPMTVKVLDAVMDVPDIAEGEVPTIDSKLTYFDGGTEIGVTIQDAQGRKLDDSFRRQWQNAVLAPPHPDEQRVGVYNNYISLDLNGTLSVTPIISYAYFGEHRNARNEYVPIATIKAESAYDATQKKIVVSVYLTWDEDKENLYKSLTCAFMTAQYVAGTYAPSFGFGTRSGVAGDYSATLGTDLVASGDQQTVIGKANVEDVDNEYAFIIGNGEDVDNRSNAFSVDWDGNTTASGSITDGSGNVLADKADASDVYTKTQTDTLLANKANTADVYTQAETDTLLADKADSSDLADFLPLTGGTVTGNLKINGDLTAGGHSSPIGTILTSHLASAKNVNKSTGTALCSISLPKGTWDVVGYVRFPSNNSGYRLANISTTSGSGSAHVTQSPLPGNVTQMQVEAIISVTANRTTYYLNAYHTSSTALTMPAGTSDGYINGIRAVRIA